MSDTYRRDPGAVRPELRKWIRDEQTSVGMKRALRTTDKEVRLGVPKLAWELYEVVPDTTPVVYDTEEHLLVVDLPEPGEATLPDKSSDGGGERA